MTDGNDAVAARPVIGEAVAAARNQRGPSLIEAQAYRLKGHSGPGGGSYRPAGEGARWAPRKPLLLSRAALLRAGTAEGARGEIDGRARPNLATLARGVLERPVPDPATAWTEVWSAWSMWLRAGCGTPYVTSTAVTAWSPGSG